MSYSLSILKRAQKELAQLKPPNYERVRDAILTLANNPRPVDCKKLAVREGWRIRVGDYRIIYEIDDTTKNIIILHVGHHSDIYR